MKTLKRGFSLVELLVAMVITSIIILVLVGMSAMGVNAWTKSRAELRASRQGKAMVEMIAKDLESGFIRKSNDLQWLYLDRQNQDLVGPENAKTANAARFAFFTAASDRYQGKIGVKGKDLGGDLSLVRYQIQYVDPINIAKNKFQTYAVYRSLINPDETFTRVLGSEAQKNLSAQFATPAIAENDFLCENVFQISFTLHVDYQKAGVKNTTQITIGLDNSASSRTAQNFFIFGDRLEVSATSLPSGVSAEDLRTGVVTRVEVMGTIITEAGLGELRRGTALSEQKLAEIVKKNSYQYVKTVQVPQP